MMNSTTGSAVHSSCDGATRRRNLGARVSRDGHATSSRKSVAPKQIGPDCKCSSRCYERVSADLRQSTFEQFHNMTDYTEQNVYLFGLIVRRDFTCDSSSGRARSERRTCSYSYHIRDSGLMITVCKVAFANIHAISFKRMRTLCEKMARNVFYPKDERGRHSNRPHRISEKIRSDMLRHIHKIFNLPNNQSYLRMKGTCFSAVKMYRDYLKQFSTTETDFDVSEVSDKRWLYGRLLETEITMYTPHHTGGLCPLIDCDGALVQHAGPEYSASSVSTPMNGFCSSVSTSVDGPTHAEDCLSDPILFPVFEEFSHKGLPPNYDFANMPQTSFSCKGRVVGGYYADPEAQCQMFHICGQSRLTSFKFLCPNNTLFDQRYMICANWHEVNCDEAPTYYSKNAHIFQTVPQRSPERDQRAAFSTREQSSERLPRRLLTSTQRIEQALGGADRFGGHRLSAAHTQQRRTRLNPPRREKVRSNDVPRNVFDYSPDSSQFREDSINFVESSNFRDSSLVSSDQEHNAIDLATSTLSFFSSHLTPQRASKQKTHEFTKTNTNAHPKPTNNPFIKTNAKLARQEFRKLFEENAYESFLTESPLRHNIHRFSATVPTHTPRSQVVELSSLGNRNRHNKISNTQGSNKKVQTQNLLIVNDINNLSNNKYSLRNNKRGSRRFNPRLPGGNLQFTNYRHDIYTTSRSVVTSSYLNNTFVNSDISSGFNHYQIKDKQTSQHLDRQFAQNQNLFSIARHVTNYQYNNQTPNKKVTEEIDSNVASEYGRINKFDNVITKINKQPSNGSVRSTNNNHSSNKPTIIKTQLQSTNLINRKHSSKHKYNKNSKSSTNYKNTRAKRPNKRVRNDWKPITDRVSYPSNGPDKYTSHKRVVANEVTGQRKQHQPNYSGRVNEIDANLLTSTTEKRWKQRPIYPDRTNEIGQDITVTTESLNQQRVYARNNKYSNHINEIHVNIVQTTENRPKQQRKYSNHINEIHPIRDHEWKQGSNSTNVVPQKEYPNRQQASGPHIIRKKIRVLSRPGEAPSFLHSNTNKLDATRRPLEIQKTNSPQIKHKRPSLFPNFLHGADTHRYYGTKAPQAEVHIRRRVSSSTTSRHTVPPTSTQPPATLPVSTLPTNKEAPQLGLNAGYFVRPKNLLSSEVSSRRLGNITSLVQLARPSYYSPPSYAPHAHHLVLTRSSTLASTYTHSPFQIQLNSGIFSNLLYEADNKRSKHVRRHSRLHDNHKANKAKLADVYSLKSLFRNLKDVFWQSASSNNLSDKQ